MTMFSLTGFRGLPSLFYYIAPAWWYVWLIIQLYLLYPFLLRWLDRSGPVLFFAGTLAITIASRAFGMLFWARLHIHLYMWMTGLFALTRLAEFTAGMVVARSVIAARQAGRREPGLWPATGLSVAIYVAGLACSLTLTGSLLSNLLVSLGLSGLFYCAWRAMRDHAPGLAAVIASAGVSSYAIYLVHHPLLIWTGVFLPGNRPLHLCAAVLAIAVSVPLARSIERATNAVADRGSAWLATHSDALSVAAGGVTFILLIAVEPLLGPRGGRAVSYLIAWSTGVALWLEWLRRSGTARDRAPEPDVCAAIRRIGLASGLLGLFIMPPGTGYLAAIAGLIIGVIATVTHGSGASPHRLWTAWSTGTVITLLIAAGAEWSLRIVAPREIGGWGERPALMIHPTRAFALIPNRTTHLRYNDYDYVIRTNGLGLASPEIPAARPTANTLRVLTTGDAFTMPEGVNYEQSFPALLDSALAQCLAPRPVQVINAGVTGYGPREEEPQFDELGAIFHPDIVVHEFYVNDWSDIMVGAQERREGIGLAKRHVTRGALFDRSDLVANARLLYERVVSGLTGRISNTQRYKLLLDYYRTGPNPLYDTLNTGPDGAVHRPLSGRGASGRGNAHHLLHPGRGHGAPARPDRVPAAVRHPADRLGGLRPSAASLGARAHHGFAGRATGRPDRPAAGLSPAAGVFPEPVALDSGGTSGGGGSHHRGARAAGTDSAGVHVVSAIVGSANFLRAILLATVCVCAVIDVHRHRAAGTAPVLAKGALAVWSGVVIGFTVFLWADHIRFPFLLDLMEGTILQHVGRAAHGLAVYPQPTPDFVPLAYNPLYYYLCAPVTWVLGLDLPAVRLVAIAGMVGSGAIIYLTDPEVDGISMVGADRPGAVRDGIPRDGRISRHRTFGFLAALRGAAWHVPDRSGAGARRPHRRRCSARPELLVQTARRAVRAGRRRVPDLP